jgi:hypothetical protein
VLELNTFFLVSAKQFTPKYDLSISTVNKVMAERRGGEACGCREASVSGMPMILLFLIYGEHGLVRSTLAQCSVSICARTFSLFLHGASFSPRRGVSLI